MMSLTTRRSLIALVIVLTVFVMFWQNHLDPLRRKYQPGKVTSLELGTQFIAATLIGLKEVVAGILWVRADEFFHTGNYEAIVPLVRIITWLDPHQIDVYDTGAWHLSYNFTDSSERSDRRYIPPAKALLREGIQNNPRIYDLYFSLGWMNFQKIQDFKEASVWFARANEKPAIDAASGKQIMRPQFVGHALAHSLERQGRIDEAIAQWEDNLRKNQEYAENYNRDFGNLGMIDVARNNLLRVIDQKKRRSKLTPSKDANFQAFWEPVSPRRFRVWGTLDMPRGCRVKIMLTDKGFQPKEMKTFSWDVDPTQTILIDDIYVSEGKFRTEIDIERDASIYPLKADVYVLKVWFTPLGAPDFAQDIIGWKGEGLKRPQKNLVNRDGIWLLEKTFEIKRSQLL